MNVTTKISKGREGFEAESRIDLGFDRRVLQVTTSKQSGRGLKTYATVIQLDATDPRVFSFVMFQDFSKAIACDLKARCTEANISALHAQALANIEPVLAQVRIQYAALIAAESITV